MAAAAGGSTAAGVSFSKTAGEYNAGLGFISSILGVEGFIERQIQKGQESVEIHFKVGVDGAHDPDNSNGPKLKDAGGRMPDIRFFGERGKYIGMINNDRVMCKAGADDCKKSKDDVYIQPAYTLFTANDDAICIAWIDIHYPSGDKYGWIGDWARACDQPWFYSDISVQSEKGNIKPACVWLDSNTKSQASTGLQLHWPDFKYKTGQAEEGWDVNYIKYLSKRRNPFRSMGPSLATLRGALRPDAKEREAKRKFDKRGQVIDQRLIKSADESHSAAVLCNSTSSRGPSLVSEHERTFCYMPNKTLYSFCEDLATGHCWNNTAHSIDAKGPVGNAMAAAPEYEFSKVMHWGQK